MLRHSFGLEAEARAVERAVRSAIDAGALPADLAAGARRAVTTAEAGDAVLLALQQT